MSNYCRDCRYNHRQATGEKACPFTTFYWDFLDQHREKFADNGRMNFQMKNLANKSENELEEIRRRAHELRRAWS
jgi:deoxyribodipyrimidine photolyase-related protein